MSNRSLDENIKHVFNARSHEDDMPRGLKEYDFVENENDFKME